MTDYAKPHAFQRWCYNHDGLELLFVWPAIDPKLRLHGHRVTLRPAIGAACACALSTCGACGRLVSDPWHDVGEPRARVDQIGIIQYREQLATGRFL